jgi:hypothetical protein
MSVAKAIGEIINRENRIILTRSIFCSFPRPQKTALVSESEMKSRPLANGVFASESNEAIFKCKKMNETWIAKLNFGEFH